ncbi:class I fructose-bisphosphate aldolase [Thiohalorhabdus methylotrophus]|uniref:fructose-bisphosphate aldolase n=1 Tax=Thiohalorhabdus methylotrophus TaxID=3242694 RepID=A0ABV4TQ43_9GAMM
MANYSWKHAEELKQTAQSMVANYKGILAADESNNTASKRLKEVGIESTEESRRKYRQLLFTAPEADKYISGVILYDETIRQADDNGTAFPELLKGRGIIPGIKVDTGAKPLAGSPDEKVTEGLDGLRERLAEYYNMGARFSKWRAVITPGEDMPTRQCMEANAHALARYSALCQENGLVPIVEPEVLINGSHSIDACEEITEENLHMVFDELYRHNVMPEGVVLKTSMVISGLDAPSRAGVEEVAERTVQTLQRVVPPALGGVVFLSGGQGDVEATQHLDVMNKKYKNQVPWRMTFSYARALQNPALGSWGSDMSNTEEAQKNFAFRAKLNSLASEGEYSEDMESKAA